MEPLGSIPDENVCCGHSGAVRQRVKVRTACRVPGKRERVYTSLSRPEQGRTVVA